MRNILLSIILISITLSLFGQGYEIRTTNKSLTEIAVEVRATNNPVARASLITDMVFGIRWKDSFNTDLSSTILTGYNIKKSDSRSSKGGYYYQAFYADNIPFTGTDWPLNNWIEIMSVNNTSSGTGTGSFEVCPAGFDATTNPNIGIDLTDYMPVINGSSAAVTPPVYLTGFSATPSGKEIKTAWIAIQNNKIKYFVLQRSLDGVAFDSIAVINSSGNTTGISTYQYTDYKVQADTIYYYRLKIMDVDGKISYSNVQSATIKSEQAEGFTLSPNPANARLKLTYNGASINGNVRIKIIDAKGAVVLILDKNIITGNFVDVDISRIASGAYVFIIEQNKELLYNIAFQKL